MMTIRPTILALTFNHIVLPPKLPGEQDSQVENVEKDLLHRLLDAVKALKDSSDGENVPVWQSIKKSLWTCSLANENGFVNKVSLLNALKELQPDNAIILRITEQNAGLLIRQPRDNEQTVIFEAFETSPAVSQTLAAQGALQWDFPGVAVSLPLREFENPVFQESLATFLEKASIEPLDEFAVKTRKAGVEVSESRDTVDPAIITQFLMTLLDMNGSRIYPPVLRKRVKDDVCWDNAELPWRRSPFWLVLRVCIQRLLHLHLGREVGHMQYKFLMCYLMARLLQDCVNILSPEQCNFLKTKLCRRLAKLETEKENSPPAVRAAYVHLFGTIGPFCQQSIEVAATAVENEWKSFKRELQRRIPSLPLRAQEKDLHLTLPNSSAYFRDILNSPQHRLSKRQAVDPLVVLQNASKNTTEQFATLTTRYSSLADLERTIEFEVREVPTLRDECEALCIELACRIEAYLTAVGDAYDDNPEQMSVFILSIFELWVHMDKCATIAYPLLYDYHPWLNPELLDVLLLSRLSDMKRLQRIQLYLHDRCTEAPADQMTVFTDPFPGCFADRYFDLGAAANLHNLQQRIEAESLRTRNAKTARLEQVNAEYKSLTEQMTLTPCTQLRNPDGTHDIKGCRYCYYVRSRRRLKIEVHEDFLPSERNIIQKRAIVFELGIPKPFAAYRNTTWNIINTLCPQPDSSIAQEPEMLLGDYSQLMQYNSNKGHRGLSLASHTKSYLGTHYNSKKLPAKAESVLLPLGLTFSYYDAGRNIWSGDFVEPLTFAHHFAIHLPKHLPFSALYSSPAFAVDGTGPSSYEVIANISECPSELTVHEFIAHQNLMAGKNRRWLSIVAELGSSNINFSLQDTTALFHHLALQAGPRLDDDNLRAVHVIFRDVQFCNRLIEQIDQHVTIISANWRENNYMETLLTLTIQLCALGSSESSVQAYNLLLKIRRVTLGWITLLRNETRNTQEVDIAERAARYCFVSALLCRRTFSPKAYSNTDMDAESFTSFVEATLAMQESLVVDLSKFTITTRNMLIRDIKMTARISAVVRRSVTKHPTSLAFAIDTVWPKADQTPRQYTEWVSLRRPYKWWVTSTARTTEYGMPQVVHYHVLQGHLLVDGQAMGKLPADIRNSEILKELFGNQQPVAFPSNMPGMSYMLAINKEGHQVHLGYRNQQLVIRAQRSSTVLELVPRHVFVNGLDFDLPRPLIDNCVHWIDLQSGILEVRRHPRIWKESNWTINIRARRAQRRRISLVDPHSNLFKLIAQIFHNFEQPHMLVVFQPSKGNLSVELRRMDLIFHVNKKNLLQCKQLAAEVDPNQDAGTLYGLQSMLVLRNVINRSQRSIISTMGGVHYRRHGMHVVVQMENTGTYARYLIDNVLGRLHSPPEPRLLYNKAQLHAFTSCFVPDPLTGRTGTEEALSCLQSGYCQPWIPLDPRLMNMLITLSNLTPRREYYPKDKKCQQIVHWDPHLTTTIQHDAYIAVINSIIKKSERLSLFQVDSTDSTTDPPSNVKHLRKRAYWRRCIYERSGILSPEPAPPPDLPYISRDGWSISKRTSRVREVVYLLRQRPLSIRTTPNLTSILQQWSIIGGYTNEFTPYLLEECLSGDLALEWGSLVSLCRDCVPEDAYHLMFRLGVVAFRNGINMTVVRVIVAFFLLQDLRELHYPLYSSFTGFEADEKPTIDALLDVVRPYCEPYRDTRVARKKGKKWDNSEETRRFELAKKEHDQKCASESEMFVSFLTSQWPCVAPSIDGFDSTNLDVVRAVKAIIPEWLRLYKNLQLSNHIREVQTILDCHSAPTNAIEVHLIPNPQKQILGFHPRCHYALPRFGEELLQKSGPRPDVYCRLENVEKWTKDKLAASWQTTRPECKLSSTPEIIEIERIVNDVMGSDCSVRSQYGQDLKKSIAALKMVQRPAEEQIRVEVDFNEGIASFNEDITRARTVVHQLYIQITESLSRGDSRFLWLQQGNLWPSVTPVSILQQLRSTSHYVFEPNMKDAFISYGLAILKLQRLIRMKEAFAKQDKGKLHQERNSPGHVNWDPSVYPDWLLLEIDANMQIREEQVTVALEMIAPTSGSNSVLQMNMGQGKTSVIMPMVASVLAQGEILTRILVPQALLSQTAQILQSRLGGLLGREITHIPFSRRTPTTPDLILEYRKLHEDMLHGSHIILGIPEHVLSFKLSGLQRVSDSKISEAVNVIAIQHWMNQACRDILDECDFTLAVKTQLIYPSGSQLAVDGHPHRWEVTMLVLGLVAHHLCDLARDFPQSIEVLERTATGFPVAYFLREDVEKALTQKIVDNVCSGQTFILPIRGCTDEERDAIRNFISQETVDRSVTEHVSKLFPDAPKARKNVYLLRGLLAHGILLLCLKKKWNVQYGLHPGRDPMAVPFHAKGVPSDQAEWGHPDVAILFTCLAFYYEGLSEKQLRQNLQAVLRSDDPVTEYYRWTQASTTLPEPLRHWNIINVDDERQVAEIWRHLRLTAVVINYFLSNFVFPVHAKQFNIKLQASGWDVPLYSDSPNLPLVERAKRPGLTTGFSGTNDNRRLLPLTIEQQDLPGLSHTNAEVLTYLLQKRNRKYRLAADTNGRRLSELGLLAHLTQNGIRILIDAGAFILEMDNQTLVRAWLQQDPDTQAAVYFGSDNKAWVQYQTGKTVPLLATPFADNLDKCFVYLDEAHTRGTDLKLPSAAQGALTLGLNQTKDHTVQAAMRLRLLGTTQSITFVAPPEVHRSILDVCKKGANSRLDSSDVITWLLDQTCTSNRELQPLYFAQGADFCHRMQAATSFKKFLTDFDQRNAYMEVLQQPEQQTLEQLYEPQMPNDDRASSPDTAFLPLSGKVSAFMQQLRQRQQQSHAIHGSITSSVLEEVEQEREVTYEIEEEREVQRPRLMKALKYPGLHKSIRNFARTGLLEGNGFMKASTALESTQLGLKYGIQASSLLPHLYASIEFTRTVQLKRGERNDDFTRPVTWILWNMQIETALVVIPEEAETLIPIIRTTAVSSMHLIMYAAPFTRKMLHFNRLNYYALPSLPAEWAPPSWLPFELGILGGRLYFDFSEYNILLDRLHLNPRSLSAYDPVENSNTTARNIQATAKDHLSFLQEWLAVRRQGQDISHTPMGYVCQGWKLRSDHPFFSMRKAGEEVDNANIHLLHPTSYTACGENEEYYDSDEDEEEAGVIETNEDGESEEDENDTH